jgi:hypothetical protein
VCSMWFLPRCYKQLTKTVLVEFCTGGCEERTRKLVRVAEESPLLEAIPRERLVKTQQAGKKLSVCCGNL